MSELPKKKIPAKKTVESRPGDSPWEKVYPATFRNREAEAIAARNGKAKPGSSGARNTKQPGVGLALSGGGIRSATFCLGVLQEMARTSVKIGRSGKTSLLRQVDYLSTVSGGGYIGSFLGTLFVRSHSLAQVEAQGKETETAPDTKPVEHVEACLSDNRSEPLKWLRENGRYLAPNGTGDLLTAGAVHLRNWISVAVVVALTLLPLFLLLFPLAHLVGLSGYVKECLHVCFARPEKAFWWWSPAWGFVGLAGIATLAAGAAYWFVFTSSTQNASKTKPLRIVRLVAFIAPWPVLWVAGFITDGSYTPIAAALTIIAVLALVFYLAARWRSEALKMSPTPETLRKIRNRLARWSKGALAILLATVVYALVDSMGQSLYVSLYERGFAGTIYLIATGLAVLLPAVRAVWRRASETPEGKRRNLPIGVMATVIAGTLFLLFLVNVNLLAQGLAWGWTMPAEGETLLQTSWVIALLALIISVQLAWAGSHLAFLNATSGNTLYGARLARAYLGATNPVRHQAGAFNVTEPVPGDDLELSSYKPHEWGGPLHLINVTFNETISAKSNLENRDRQGMAFTVGPAGLSVGRQFHATWKNDIGKAIDPVATGSRRPFEMFPESGAVEDLTLARWASISGAAFGTGLGGRTSFGLSLLAGLANIRLGYWWDSGIEPETHFAEGDSQRRETRHDTDHWFARFFPAQSYLFDEWFANFHGPRRRHWYFSDGGHFENSAAYELLRRRVRHIVCCDCGADPEYRFADLANLTRKARIDFGAEIRFVSRNELVAACEAQNVELPQEAGRSIDSPETFSRTASEEKRPKPHALLAVVRYPAPTSTEPSHSLILFLKPALSGDEPVDLREYQARHSSFPQEPTSDQFFNEAQWESYRKLGEHTAQNLFGESTAAPFWFTKLDPEKF